jgi:diacylglycerol kinase (ATP)
MANKKLFIIWNPNSGGRGRSILNKFQHFLTSQEVGFEIHDTSVTKNATETVKKKLDQTFSDLVIIGGDGTINEAINGLNHEVTTSIIPAGTGDDFIKMVDLGSGLEKQFHTAVHGEVEAIDLGVCNERKFINGVGVGFDGQIVEDMAAKRVPLLKGHAAYYYHVLRILGGYREKPFRYRFNDVDFQKDLILLTIGNGSTFGGGFKLMPKAQINDGLLEICEIGRLAPIKRFLNIPRLSNGSHGVLPRIHFYQTSQITVEANSDLFAHIDGERLGNPPFEIRILPKALRLRVKSLK